MSVKSTLAKGMTEATSKWWVLLISGSAWVVLSMAILQFNLTSVWSIAVLTGVVLLMAATTEFGIAALAPRWSFAHVLLGLALVIGGVMAFAWPAATFVVLARLVSWYLIFLGTFEIVESLSYRWELWWLRLIAGIASIAIAFWAANSFVRSATLLVLWVGIAALMRGVTQMFLAIEWRDVHEQAKKEAGPAPSVPKKVDLTEGKSHAML
jgi:uncharacterized membrane protein HdeD (DUF308 family)